MKLELIQETISTLSGLSVIYSIKKDGKHVTDSTTHNFEAAVFMFNQLKENKPLIEVKTIEVWEG